MRVWGCGACGHINALRHDRPLMTRCKACGMLNLLRVTIGKRVIPPGVPAPGNRGGSWGQALSPPKHS